MQKRQSWLGFCTTETDKPSISVNGIAGKLQSNEVMMNGQQQLTYSIPRNVLRGVHRV